jgi:hypothetical protein
MDLAGWRLDTCISILYEVQVPRLKTTEPYKSIFFLTFHSSTTPEIKWKSIITIAKTILKTGKNTSRNFS